MSDSGNSDEAAALRRLLFRAERSAIYHEKRFAHYQGIQNWMTFFSLLMGSSAAVAVYSASDLVAALAAGSVALIQAGALAFGVADKAYLHQRLRIDSIQFTKELRKAEAGITQKRLTDLEIRQDELYAEEPPLLNVLNAICHDELIRAGGYDESEMSNVTKWQNFFANWFDWFPSKVRKKGK